MKWYLETIDFSTTKLMYLQTINSTHKLSLDMWNFGRRTDLESKVLPLAEDNLDVLNVPDKLIC